MFQCDKPTTAIGFLFPITISLALSVQFWSISEWFGFQAGPDVCFFTDRVAALDLFQPTIKLYIYEQVF